MGKETVQLTKPKIYCSNCRVYLGTATECMYQGEKGYLCAQCNMLNFITQLKGIYISFTTNPTIPKEKRRWEDFGWMNRDGLD